MEAPYIAGESPAIKRQRLEADACDPVEATPQFCDPSTPSHLSNDSDPDSKEHAKANSSSSWDAAAEADEAEAPFCPAGPVVTTAPHTTDSGPSSPPTSAAASEGDTPKQGQKRPHEQLPQDQLQHLKAIAQALQQQQQQPQSQQHEEQEQDDEYEEGEDEDGNEEQDQQQHSGSLQTGNQAGSGDGFNLRDILAASGFMHLLQHLQQGLPAAAWGPEQQQEQHETQQQQQQQQVGSSHPTQHQQQQQPGHKGLVKYPRMNLDQLFEMLLRSVTPSQVRKYIAPFNKWSQLCGSKDIGHLLRQGPETLLEYYRTAVESEQLNNRTVFESLRKIVVVLEFPEVQRLLPAAGAAAGEPAAGSWNAAALTARLESARWRYAPGKRVPGQQQQHQKQQHQQHQQQLRRAAADEDTAAAAAAAVQDGAVAVVCGTAHGMFDVARLRVTCWCDSCGGKAMSATEFERHGGRGKAKHWRKSIKVDVYNMTIGALLAAQGGTAGDQQAAQAAAGAETEDAAPAAPLLLLAAAAAAGGDEEATAQHHQQLQQCDQHERVQRRQEEQQQQQHHCHEQQDDDEGNMLAWQQWSWHMAAVGFEPLPAAECRRGRQWPGQQPQLVYTHVAEHVAPVYGGVDEYPAVADRSMSRSMSDDDEGWPEWPATGDADEADEAEQQWTQQQQQQHRSHAQHSMSLQDLKDELLSAGMYSTKTQRPLAASVVKHFMAPFNKWGQLCGSDDVGDMLAQGPEALLEHYRAAVDRQQLGSVSAALYLDKVLCVLGYPAVQRLLLARSPGQAAWTLKSLRARLEAAKDEFEAAAVAKS